MFLLRLACASAALALWIGAASADEFGAMLMKVEGDTITFFKTGNTTAPKTLTMTAAKDLKVIYQMAPHGLRMGTKVETGDKVENGLKNRMFERIRNPGVPAILVTGKGGEVTEVKVRVRKPLAEPKKEK